ncbi:TetR/AcrR family transcriptional regulator [Robiginitalea sp.]|uniref:TetR/AcrR family transcriptional regulator n=1 Tax=Robiginitalea sp. TaxID=1902411 RepID=UPI003C77AE5F
MSQNYSNKPKIILKNKAVFRKSDKTRQAILDAALDYLWTKPYRSLTVNELMSKAGSSRSVFYRYYDDLPTMMEHLLNEFKDKIMAATGAWLNGEGDPIPLLVESLDNLVEVSYQYGPILRAVLDAAPMNERLEKAWTHFAKDFDDAVTHQIEHQQAAGLIKPFDARPVATALNRMNSEMVSHHFGHSPRGSQTDVRDAIIRVWVATLYGDSALNSCFIEEDSSINSK